MKKLLTYNFAYLIIYGFIVSNNLLAYTQRVVNNTNKPITVRINYEAGLICKHQEETINPSKSALFKKSKFQGGCCINNIEVNGKKFGRNYFFSRYTLQTSTCENNRIIVGEIVTSTQPSKLIRTKSGTIERVNTGPKIIERGPLIVTVYPKGLKKP